MPIKAEEKDMRRIFCDDYVFTIPEYQRPYAWTTEETGELLEDLMAATSEVQEYFLGSIVLIKDPNQTIAQVVDGQQRLTTLTILFCVLRDLAQGTEMELNLDKRVCERGNRLDGTEDRFRLSIRERDRAFFEKNVQAVGALPDFHNQDPARFTDSQRCMHENATYLWDHLLGLDQGERDRLAIFLNQHCFLVVVSASDHNSAYRIFSVLNDRGLELLPTDILKARIIGEIDAAMRNEYTNTWEGIEEDLGRDEFRDLFSHIRMIHMKTRAREELHQEFSESVLRDISGKEFIDKTLEPMSDAYAIVSGAAYKSTDTAEHVNEYLRHLGRIDNFDWTPPAIIYFHLHQNEHAHLVRFVRDLERLAYSMFILRSRSNDRVSRYAKVIAEIQEGRDLSAATSSLQLSEWEISSVVDGLNGDVYLQTAVRRPLLLRLDSLLAEPGATYDHKVITIEHVLPQSPSEDSEWCELFSESEVAGWTHKLANLVLLSRRKNSQAQNFEFERKKREYFQVRGTSTFALTARVLQEDCWTPSVLEERQKELVGRLRDEWRL